MISAFSKAFSQLLTDPRMWKLVILSALVSLLAFLGLWGILGGLLRWLAQHVDRFRSALEWGGWIVSFSSLRMRLFSSGCSNKGASC